jgi:hypothetical protein
MDINWIAVVVAALMPMALGFAWYHPKVLGNAWMKEAGLTEEDIQGGNMGMIFGLSFVLSLLLAMFVNSTFIHQFAIDSLAMGSAEATDASTAVGQAFASVKEHSSGLFRTFGHGVVHGIITGLFFVLPILGTNAMFERKSWKYILVNTGYWMFTLALMGGILCAWV